MSGPVTERPAVCLNMIVRNEVHVVAEALDAVAPYISSWVIVDTGSDDGTQDLIRDHLAGLGIPGELYERPWQNFGHNRTEALTLAQGHGDYIWVMDADDTVVGSLDFSRLDADVYRLRRRVGAHIYWRPELFRDGTRVHWVGATHEYATWDEPYSDQRLDGEYHIQDRQLSARNLSGEKFARDRDLLLPEVRNNPDDTRSVFYLAQSYFDLKDFSNAHKWYARRVEMGGWDQEIYYSMLRVAESRSQLGAPWSEIADAYLRAWEFRPTRAEALYALAFRYRVDQRYQLGYLFAERAAAIPLPEEDTLFVNADVYAWRAVDEQAICAYWIGKQAEAFALCRRLLARADLPDDDRQRITRNRDFSVPAMLEAASSYPTAVAGLCGGDAEVTVSLIAGPDRAVVEASLNSFLNCCLDVARVGRFLVAGLSAGDRVAFGERYPFVEFTDAEPAGLREQVHGRFWLHLGQGWRFFAPEHYITRLTAVLDAEPQVYQVGVNVADAARLTGTCATEQTVRRAPGAGRYVLGDAMTRGPAMFDTARLDQTAGPRTATLDEVLCLGAV